jgi:hypothetical protein
MPATNYLGFLPSTSRMVGGGWDFCTGLDGCFFAINRSFGTFSLLTMWFLVLRNIERDLSSCIRLIQPVYFFQSFGFVAGCCGTGGGAFTTKRCFEECSELSTSASRMAFETAVSGCLELGFLSGRLIYDWKNEST